MSEEKTKYVIGLTGNIGTGKSVVRHMLEHLGAYGIDADSLAHRAIQKGAPGYKPVVKLFGQWILHSNGEINRKKLASIVFNDPSALAALEAVVHPMVTRAVEMLIDRSPSPIIVVEAIKLLETDLLRVCDSVWTTYAPEQVQLERLTSKRNLSREAARQRIRAQAPQSEKVARADLVVVNDYGFEKVWSQVNAAWNKIPLAVELSRQTREQQQALMGRMRVLRASPRQADLIAAFLNDVSQDRKEYTRLDVMEAFGEKAFLLLMDDKNETPYGLIGWQVENLISRTLDLIIKPEVKAPEAIKALIEAMEEASISLESEVSLVFVPKGTNLSEEAWKQLGYTLREPDDLETLAWQEAALEGQSDKTDLFVKVLRSRRVMRPL
ncbi:MAG: dephospho-CoA kinase [Anaerolineaceae bacterium]|nr:dephospho-CoA kinase [Anaerolineaceae bacterium]